MKKYLFMLIGMVLSLSFVACTDQDDVEISYESQIVFSAEQLFNGFQPENNADFSKMEGWTLQMFTYIYDENGNLVKASKGTSDNLTKKLQYKLDLVPGKYKVVSLCCFKDDISDYWTISGFNKLNTLTVTEENENPFASAYETLGYDIRDITIGGNSLKEEVYFRPLTCLVQMELHCHEVVKNYNETYGFSTTKLSDIFYFQIGDKYYHLFDSSTINQKSNCNIVRFPNGQPEFGYTSQKNKYTMLNVDTEYLLSLKSGVVYQYRALLPQEKKDFSFSFIVESTSGEVVQDSYPTSSDRGYLKLESGKQYDIDLFYPVLYMRAGEHDPDMSQETRLNDIIKYVDPENLTRIKYAGEE